jgi:hypothetical protein
MENDLGSKMRIMEIEKNKKKGSSGLMPKIRQAEKSKPFT